MLVEGGPEIQKTFGKQVRQNPFEIGGRPSLQGSEAEQAGEPVAECLVGRRTGPRADGRTSGRKPYRLDRQRKADEVALLAHDGHQLRFALTQRNHRAHLVMTVDAPATLRRDREDEGEFSGRASRLLRDRRSDAFAADHRVADGHQFERSTIAAAAHLPIALHPLAVAGVVFTRIPERLSLVEHRPTIALRSGLPGKQAEIITRSG